MGGLATQYEKNKEISEERLRNKKFIKMHKKRSKALKSPIDKKNGFIIFYHHRNQIWFTIKSRLHPDSLSLLYQHGWRWNSKSKVWINKYTSENLDFAERFLYGKGYDERYDPDDVWLGY